MTFSHRLPSQSAPLIFMLRLAEASQSEPAGKEDSLKFRRTMRALQGELQYCAGPEVSGEERTACLKDVWERIYGLHVFFTASAREAAAIRVNELITLLLLTRRQWRGKTVSAEQLMALAGCLKKMADENHTQELIRQLYKALEASGVDVRAGF